MDLKLLKFDRTTLHFILLIVVVVAIDQYSKLWIMKELLPFEQRVVVPGFFNLVYVTNTGAAFGILAGENVWWRQFFFVTVAVVALLIILIAYKHIRLKGRICVYSIALIAGGALGNLIDRLRFGAVIDFLDFYIKSYHWPAFNVADSAITTGVGLFLVWSFFSKDSKPL